MKVLAFRHVPFEGLGHIGPALEAHGIGCDYDDLYRDGVRDPDISAYAGLIFLGGPMSEGRMGEGDEVVMVVVADLNEAKAQAKAKWNGKGRGHVDALQQIDVVDGFELRLEPVGEGDRTELDSFN